jgi:site-specific recombinase XerD
MLTVNELFPRVHRRYSSLPILGRILKGYGDWLLLRGYPRARIQQHYRTARRLEGALWERGARCEAHLTRDKLRACAPAATQDDADLAGLVSSLERFLEDEGLLVRPFPTGVERKVAVYGAYLQQVRGFAPSTARQHVATASRFLSLLGYEARPACLRKLGPADIEAFVRTTGERIGRASLQHTVAQVRGFLRFLAATGEAPTGLDTEIDMPRVYRGEQLPRALPWATVQEFLRSIDRSTPLGMRDYAIFLLVATYGLRASDIVALTLDDIEWRARRFRVVQRKTGTPLLLPLTDAVGASLAEYLRRSRPPLPRREVFLRFRAPAGALKSTAVTEAFQAWSRRSGLRIPFQGPHCLRHSFAVHLLREGVSLKTIGDVLGHRTAESTCVYLRLAVEDLRDVALPLPTHHPVPEVRP